MDAAADFAATVKRVRYTTRLTIGQLARRAGVSASYLGELERGDKRASDTVKQRIETALIDALNESVGEPARE